MMETMPATSRLKYLKWTFVALLLVGAGGVAVDLGHSAATYRYLRMYPPLEREFRAVRVGMTKKEVREIFEKKRADFFAGKTSETDGWSFSGPRSCYMVAFDPATRLVSAKFKTYPPSCIEDVEPRDHIIRWVWEKWDQIH